MYTVWHWNWGWYRTVFRDLEDAEYNYVQRCEIARINHGPHPYVTDENGNKLNFEWEKDDES